MQRQCAANDSTQDAVNEKSARSTDDAMDESALCESAPRSITRPLVFRGRGVTLKPDGRFESQRRKACEDGWDRPEEEEEDTETLPTELIIDTSKSVITRNRSPDISFELSINPYRGYEHGCIHCFARPGHSYLGFPAGLDFETKIAYKPDVVAVFRKELARKSYRCHRRMDRRCLCGEGTIHHA